MNLTEDGGLTAPLPSGTRSLLIRFRSLDRDQVQPGMFGAVLTSHASRHLAPGQEADVEITFWSDEVHAYASVGASLDLWYGRVVGGGSVTEVTDD